MIDRDVVESESDRRLCVLCHFPIENKKNFGSRGETSIFPFSQGRDRQVRDRWWKENMSISVEEFSVEKFIVLARFDIIKDWDILEAALAIHP